MTRHIVRLYIASASVLGLFLAWAGIAAHPWPQTQSSAAGAQAQALAQYQQRLQLDAALVRKLTVPESVQAPTPRVRIVTLPPLTTTRTS
ncbi:MAG: hypothetical protein OEW52_04380 [Thermoleophilia bacterium]|nr:hypothetical protein [Thermoleophilia bacterium]MDH4340978.1 hypothetical protein [Thermoleophilia bacterium]MDH5280371.1 hypothetical protein [Thermoleophilia bacterium]